MDKTLNARGILAIHFAGVSIPAEDVNGVSIEPREGVEDRLLTNRATRSFPDTTNSYVEFDTLPGRYYLVIWHRSDLEIMTNGTQRPTAATPLPYDFTTAQTQAYGINR